MDVLNSSEASVNRFDDDLITVSSQSFNTSIYVLSWIIAVGIIMGNSLTLICIWKYSYLRHTKNMFIGSLSAADLLCGLGLAYRTLRPHSFNSNCITGLQIFFLDDLPARIPVYASMFNLVVIAIDKFIAIVFPLHYKMIMTKRVFIILVFTTWFIPICTGLLLLLYSRHIDLLECNAYYIVPVTVNVWTFVITYVVIVALLTVMYGTIFRRARHQAQQISTVQNNSMTGPSSSVRFDSY